MPALCSLGLLEDRCEEVAAARTEWGLHVAGRKHLPQDPSLQFTLHLARVTNNPVKSLMGGMESYIRGS